MSVKTDTMSGLSKPGALDRGQWSLEVHFFLFQLLSGGAVWKDMPEVKSRKDRCSLSCISGHLKP